MPLDVVFWLIPTGVFNRMLTPSQKSTSHILLVRSRFKHLLKRVKIHSIKYRLGEIFSSSKCLKRSGTFLLNTALNNSYIWFIYISEEKLSKNLRIFHWVKRMGVKRNSLLYSWNSKMRYIHPYTKAIKLQYMTFLESNISNYQIFKEVFIT